MMKSFNNKVAAITGSGSGIGRGLALNLAQQGCQLALADLDKIEAYITEDHSPIVAIDAVLKIIETTEIILPDHPGAGRTGRVKGTLELVIDSAPFIVFYRQVGRLNQIQILRVLHDAQQWPKSTS